MKFGSSPFANKMSVSTNQLNELNCSCFCHIINILLTELSRSVWENLDLGRVYRPHCVRSVLTTSVKILPYRPSARLIRANYYMANSVSGQDEPDRGLWLATRASKIEPSCPLGTSHCIPQEKFPRESYNKYFIDQACSVKMAGYRPRSFFFCQFMDLDFVSVLKHAKNEVGQYLAILTSHLVNNSYILPCHKSQHYFNLPWRIHFDWLSSHELLCAVTL